jgi:hypothetical protein
MDAKELITRLRVVGATVHADDGRLEISRVPAYARPLAAKLKQRRAEAVRFLLSGRSRVWIDELEQDILVAEGPATVRA